MDVDPRIKAIVKAKHKSSVKTRSTLYSNWVDHNESYLEEMYRVLLKMLNYRGLDFFRVDFDEFCYWVYYGLWDSPE